MEKELDNKLITHRVDIVTAQNGYDAAAAVAKGFAEETPYQLGEFDCMSLVGAMLAAQKATEGAQDKLIVPDKSKFQTPHDYLSQLLNQNGIPLE